MKTCSQLVSEIKQTLDALALADIHPARIFVNVTTRTVLTGIFSDAPIVRIPRGYERIDTIYGVEIVTAPRLPDGLIDYGVRGLCDKPTK